MVSAYLISEWVDSRLPQIYCMATFIHPCCRRCATMTDCEKQRENMVSHRHKTQIFVSAWTDRAAV